MNEIIAASEDFWYVCTHGRPHIRALEAAGLRTNGLLRNEWVKPLDWLSQYEQVWLLKGYGIEVCQDSYQRYIDICEETVTRHNWGSRYFSRYRIPHHLPRTGRTVPPERVLTEAQFTQICRATQRQRNELHRQLLHDALTPPRGGRSA